MKSIATSTATLVSILVFLYGNTCSLAFAPKAAGSGTFLIKSQSFTTLKAPSIVVRKSTENESEVETATEQKLTLEEKMKSWEATDEELKAASLGGVIPGKNADGFDIGLALAFPLMIGTSLLFLLFPFIKDSIDVTSVGPPPTV